MAVLETILAAGGGSITGAVSGVATAYFQMKLQEAQVPLHMKELDVEVELAKQARRTESDRQMEETRREEIRADRDITVAAQQNDRATYGIMLVDLIRGLLRPLVAGWCIYLLSDLTLILWDIQDHDLNTEYWREIFKHLILTWTYLTTTVVTFYFGARGGRPPRARL